MTGTATLALRIVVGAAVLFGTSSLRLGAQNSDDTPETVITVFHAKKGQEKALTDILARAWQAYEHDKVVFDQPNVLVRGTDADGNSNFTEIFTWVSHSAPDHASDAIQAIWKEMNAACESRGGHPGIEFKEVELIVPKE